MLLLDACCAKLGLGKFDFFVGLWEAKLFYLGTQFSDYSQNPVEVRCFDGNPVLWIRIRINGIPGSVCAGCSLLRAEGFSCSLNISKMHFLIKKKSLKTFSAVRYFFFSFWSSKPWIGPGFTWNSDPDSMNPVPSIQNVAPIRSLMAGQSTTGTGAAGSTAGTWRASATTCPAAPPGGPSTSSTRQGVAGSGTFWPFFKKP